MKIAYDAKRAMNNLTGLGNYSRMVLHALATEYPDLQIDLYTPRESDNPRMQPLSALPNVRTVLPTRSPGGALWRTFGITSQLQTDAPDLYHGLSNELPLNIAKCSVPSIVTMHDVIYRRLPYCYPLPDRLLYDYKYGHACRNATHIIAVSECTRRDVIHYYGVPEEKVSVVYQGCDDIFRTPPREDDRLMLIHRFPTLPRRYILQVGTIERRKNAEQSVRALQGLPPDVGLVLVGKGGKYRDYVQKLARELNVNNRLTVLSGVSMEEIARLNRCATAVVYPSRYEGFGIPILEALCSGTPVVAATGSCLEEAGGPSSIYVSPDDPSALSQALNSLIDGTIDTAAMTAAGHEYAQRFNTASVARETMAVYTTLLQPK